MKNTIIDIQELSDSKELYAQRPNPFIPGFIYTLVALLLAAILYASVGTIEIVATGKGIVRPNDAVSTLAGTVSGRVTAVNYTDGQFVRQGDVLLTVDMSDTEIRLRNAESSLKKAETQLALLDRFLSGIETEENPFSDDSQSEEYPYYVEFESYLLSLNAKQKSFDDERNKNYSSIQSYKDQIYELNERQKGLSAYRESIESGENRAVDYPEYANLYAIYEASVAGLREEYANGSFVSEESLALYRSQAADYELLVNSVSSGSSRFSAESSSQGRSLYEQYCSELAAYTLSVELAQTLEEQEAANTALDTFKNQKQAEYAALLENSKTECAAAEASYAKGQTTLKAAIEQNRLQTLSSIDSELKALREQLITVQSNLRAYSYASELAAKNVDQNGNALTVSLATSEELASVLNRREQVEAQLEELKMQIEQLQEQLMQGKIIAENSGFVHEATTLVIGDVLTSGTVIGTIIPVNESAYKVQIYLSSADIGGIEVGDPIRYNIAALPSRQYGSISGEVLRISKDVLLQNGQFSGYFLVEGSIDGTSVEDKDGNVGKLVIGMETEARIVTQKKTILRYLWEKIDF